MIIFSALPEEVKGLPLQNYEVILTGVGKINATRKLTEYIQNESFVGPVINYGTAGKASDKVEVGKVYSVNEFIQRDMDAISLHIPLNNETKNLINFDLLKTMRKNCIIINAARGGIINEIELDQALKENLIFGAGLDVFETEPPKSDNPLLKNDKVFLSPHTAAFTEECMIRMGKETIQNIIDFFEKKLDKSKIIKL